MMSGNLGLKIVANNAIEMEGMKMDTDYLSGAPLINVQQTDIQSDDNKANLQVCKEGIATSADDPNDPLNTFSHIEANMESLTSGDGMPAAKHTAGISDDTEDTGHRPSIASSSSSSSSSRLKVSSAIRSSHTKKYSGWFQCPDCRQKVRGKAKFRSHMKLLHNGSSKTKTVVRRNTSRFKCGERVKGKKNLSQHCFYAHKGQTRIKNIAKTKKNCSSNPPRCAVFADSTSQRSTYVEKSNTEIKHLRLGPWFTCRSCDHIFKGRSQLQEHVRLKHQGLNEACKIQPSIPQITHSAKSEQCQGSGDRKLMDEAGTELAPECPVGNQDGESVVGSNEKELSRTKHRIWHQCDLCGVKVEGRKKLQRHIDKCKGKKQTTTPTVMTLQTSLSAYEASATINRSWYKCKHCCRHFRGKKRFMQHIRLCVKAPQHGAALWHRMSHLKQCSWYRCSGCQHTFKGKKRIQLHAFECHTEVQSSCPSVETGKQSFEKRSGHTCTLCQKHFQRRLFLDKHMRKCQGRQRKINLSKQGSIDDLQSSEHRLGQEHGESCEVRDDNAPQGQTIEENDESRALKTQVDGHASSQLTLVFLQDGSWYKCEICGQNLRGKEQIKKHSHDQNNKELESLNTSCLESEFLKVGSWHGCKICGKKLRGKEQVKSHAHAHKIRNPEQQELHNVTCLESNFLKVGTWRRCKVCGENLRGKEQLKNHSHDLKFVNPDDGKTECPNLSPPCLDFIQVGTWYSCKVCGQKLQGRKQMQAHSHSQPVDEKVQGNSLGPGIQDGLRSVEDGFIQVGSWYTCKSCLVRYRGRHSAEVHHRYKCFLGVGGDCHKDLLREHHPEHCSDPRQGQDGVLCHDVQPTRDNIAHDIHQPTGDDIAHDIHQPTSDDIAHDIHQPTSDDIAHDIHQPTSVDIAYEIHQPTRYDIAHDIHQPTSDDIAHDIHQPTSDDIAHDINQPTSDDIVHDIHQPTSDDMQHDIHQPTSDDMQHDIHQPTSDVQRHGESEQYGSIDQAVSSMVSVNLTVRDYIIKNGKCWECRVCSKMILSWIGAFKHVRSHFTWPSLDCSICNKSFSSSWNRIKHERTHDTGNGSSTLKKHCLKKSHHSSPLQRKTMNPSNLTSRNRKKFSKPRTAAACSQKTNIQRPNNAVAPKELTLRGCDLKSSSTETWCTTAAGAPVADAFVGDASVVCAPDEGGDASNGYAVADADIEAPTLTCYGTSEDNRDNWHKDQAYIESGRRDKSPTIVHVHNESVCADKDYGTFVSWDQTYLCNDVLSSDDKMTSELWDTSKDERQSVEDVQHNDYILFSDYEDDNLRDNLCVAEWHEEQHSNIMSYGAKAPTETEYQKLYQTYINLSSEMNQGKQEQDNNNQENMENESMNIRDLNVALSDDVNCLSRTLLERSDTDSHDDGGLSESGYGKVAVVQDCSLDADLIMSDLCRHPDLAWSDDEFMPLTDIHKDNSMHYDPHSRKEDTLNISRRRVSQDNDKRSQKSQIRSDMMHEGFDVMDSARAGRKNLPNSKHGKNRIAASTKCRMKTVCKPKQSYDVLNFQLMPSGDSERWRKRKQDAANQFAGEVDDKQISDDRITHEGHGHKAILECSRTSSGQIDFVDTSSSDVNRKKSTLYKTRNELYVPERVTFERGQKEKGRYMDCLDDGGSMSRSVRGMSVKTSCNQSCDRSTERDQKSRQGRYVCSLCYKTFASETVAADHLKQHARHRKSKASNFRKKTIINVGFKKHCRVCQRIFTNQGDLELHEHRHLVEDTVGTSNCVRCEICGERYRTQKLLDQHKVGHQVWLKCSHCNLYFAKVTELHQHCMVARHFVCECGDAFTSYAKLDIHRDDCIYSN